MRHAFIAVLTATMILSGCERLQANYEKSKPADGWVFDYTRNKMLWWGVAGLVLISLGNRDLNPNDDELNW